MRAPRPGLEVGDEPEPFKESILMAAPAIVKHPNRTEVLTFTGVLMERP